MSPISLDSGSGTILYLTMVVSGGSDDDDGFPGRDRNPVLEPGHDRFRLGLLDHAFDGDGSRKPPEVGKTGVGIHGKVVDQGRVLGDGGAGEKGQKGQKGRGGEFHFAEDWQSRKVGEMRK